jgi:hypothetical protein
MVVAGRDAEAAEAPVRQVGDKVRQ